MSSALSRDKASLVIIRDKKELHLTVTVGTAQSEAQRASIDQEKVGMTVITLTPEIAAQYRLAVTKGVVITQVAQGGPAEDIGLQPGDVIMRVGDEQVQTADEFCGLVEQANGRTETWRAVARAAWRYGHHHYHAHHRRSDEEGQIVVVRFGNKCPPGARHRAGLSHIILGHLS